MQRTAQSSLLLLGITGALAIGGAIYFSSANWGNEDVSFTFVDENGVVINPDANVPSVIEDERADAIAWNVAFDVPEGWIVTKASAAEREDGVQTYGWLASGTPTRADDPGVVRISVADVLKEGRTFAELAAEYVWDRSDAQDIVTLMREEAAELYPDFSEQDVLVATAPDTIGGKTAVRSTLQCLKACYVEGGATTKVRYLVDDGDRMHVFEVTTGTSEHTAELLNAADAVVRTSRL